MPESEYSVLGLCLGKGGRRCSQGAHSQWGEIKENEQMRVQSICSHNTQVGGFPRGSAVKNLPAVQETQVWSPGGGSGSPRQYSCLENPVDTGAWWATVHRVAKSQTWLKRLSMHTHIWAHTEYFCFSFKMSPYFFWSISLHFCSLLILSYRIFHASENVLYLYYSIK